MERPCRVSEDYGETFTEEKPVKCNNEQISVFYSTATVGSGYAYMSGQNGTIYKINYNDATATEKTVNASSVSTGRSLSSDENNNVIVGYVNDDGKVYYQLSTDGGTTFEDGIAVADATSANAAINIKTGDVLFLYSKDGKIMLHREIGVIKGNVNYINDSIEGLEPNTEYMVEVLGDNDTVTATYYISSNETGNIPFIGIDKDGNAYEDLAGKKIKITKAGTSDVSDPIDIEKRPTPEDAEQIIDENYAKPEDVAENEVLTTENSITIHPETGSKAKQSYKIFNADGTEIAGQDWVAVDENGDIVFSGLSEHTEYLIKAIVPATQTKPRSYESEGVKITTMGTIEVTNPTELSFVQDGLEHEFEITTTPADAKKEYSLLPEENYTEEIVKLKDPGRYTVYYKASKDNYRTVYGSFDVEIREAAPADIVAVAKDYNGVYDGKAHSIEIEVVAPQTGAAVSYGTKEGEYTLTANPSYTDVGTYKVFYRVTAEGRNEKTGSADIVIEKADSTVTTAPAAKTLTYNGQAQELVTAGTASGGTMKYAVTTANQEPAAEAYTFDNTSIPAKTAAGTYYVWYKVAGDGNHLDSDAGVVNVVIYEPGSPDIPTPTPTPTPVTPETTPPVSVSYGTHIQSKGWEDPAKKDGEISGTTGESKRLEAIKIDLAGNENVGIQYTTHVQGIGWMPWSCNGEVSGTTGESKRLEAIKIQLTGADKDKYDVYYRVHAQSYGWMAWAKNGEAAGTAGQSKRLEAIQVVVVEKGAAAPGDVAGVTSAKDKSYLDASNSDNPENPQVSGEDQAAVAYRTHVQTYGWQNWKANGQMAGTTGQSKRLEAININISNKPYAGGIRYKTHVQTYGWQNWKANGQMAGTTGQSKRLEAICIELTGEMAEHYDVYYRVHAQTYGWLDWASNGAPAGTEGLSKRLEGIEIVLVEKGAPAPGATDRPFVK